MTLRKRYDEAQQEFETAIRLDPKSFEAYYFYGRACFQQGKLAEAAKHLEQAGEVRPEDFQAPSLASLAYKGMGKQAEADAARQRSIAIIEKHLELNPDDARALYLGAVDLCQAGQREKSLEWAGRALAIDPEDSVVLYNVACVYALTGETDRALVCLERAVRNGSGHREWMENDSDLESLRAHPRFKALLSSI
jgi:tetratricopeptide (TPR) repeat protein